VSQRRLGLGTSSLAIAWGDRQSRGQAGHVRLFPSRLASGKLTDEDRRGLTALFWSNINPYGTFHLDMDKRLDLMPLAIPRPREAADDAARAARTAP
jgi:hypothetical protein